MLSYYIMVGILIWCSRLLIAGAMVIRRFLMALEMNLECDP